MAKVCKSFDLPCLANMVEGGRTPLLTFSELREIGFRLAIFPATGFLSVAQTLTKTYAALREHGSSKGAGLDVFPFAEMNKLMGFEGVWAFDRDHAD
jgi:2-methylisocitrate lyase-like PEP mutase family enzyme